jgi:hypothetical protein
MNKNFMFLNFVLLGLFAFSLVSADFSTSCIECSPVEKTAIQGRVYDAITNQSVLNANVEITCHGTNGDVVKNASTGMIGMYGVILSQDDCKDGDLVTVRAWKNDLSGLEEGFVRYGFESCNLNLDVAFINVPLVPEFGVVIGILTMISAVGIFFVVRKD